MAPSTPEKTALIAAVRECARARLEAEVDLLLLAAEWADLHLDATTHNDEPCGSCPTEREPGEDFGGGCAGGCPHDPDGLRDPFIPATTWDTPASLGTALGSTTQSAAYLIRDALLLRHRLPRVWARVQAYEVEARRARQIASAIVSEPRDVSDFVDATIAPVAHRISKAGIDKHIDEAMLRLYPEQRELEQLEALDQRYATLVPESINHTGIAQFVIRGDWPDVAAFDDAVSLVAAALAARDTAAGRTPEPLGVRRSQAVGILARPEEALALLNGETVPTTKRPTTLVVHLNPDHLAGRDPVAYNETLDRAELDQTLRAWCGRSDAELTVLPVLDLADHDETSRYRIKHATSARADLIAATCTFPFCQRPARHCDHDHIVPFDHADPTAGGASCDCNIAPLCRRHHQLKTHAGWRYRPLETGAWLWTDPHGQRFHRHGRTTTDVTPPDALAGFAGCRHRPRLPDRLPSLQPA